MDPPPPDEPATALEHGILILLFIIIFGLLCRYLPAVPPNPPDPRHSRYHDATLDLETAPVPPLPSGPSPLP